MSYNAKVYLVMIASPRDIYKEPDIVRKAIREWNALHSADKGVVLIPVSWDYDVPPTMGEHPQEVIDKHVLDKADLLVAIFWTRIGTPTKVAISGTVGEIQKHIEAGKPTMVYFSNESIKPDKLDKEQYDALIRFKQECQKNGLLGEFESADEFEKSFSRHLTKQIIENEYFVKSSSDSEVLLTEDDEYGEVNLSDEADLLIMEASKDRRGIIQRHAYKGRLDILTNGRKINNAHTPRDVAKWESVFEELLDFEFISEKGYNGQIFIITQKGFDYVDNK